MHQAMDRPGHGLAWFEMIGLAAILFGAPLLIDIPLLDPDEGLHAAIAQGMVESNDWVVPRMLGEPFLDKPILYFWLQALSIKVFGFHAAAVRLPGLVCGLLGSVTCGWLALELWGRRAAVWATALHMTMVVPLALAQAAVHDVALVPFTNAALVCFWKGAQTQATPRARALAFASAGVLLGGAFLTKGLIGIALVGLAYGAWLVVSRRLSWPIIAGGAAALAIAALVAIPWYVLMELRNPGYAHYYFVERHLMGFATATQRHGQRAWWYFLPILLAGGLPWLAYLPLGLRTWWPRRRDDARSAGVILAWCWLITSLVFLTLAKSKLVTYILPAFPAVALLAADAWLRLVGDEVTLAVRNWFRRLTLVICGLGMCALPIMLRVVHRRFGVEIGSVTVLAAVTVSLALLWPAWLAWHDRLAAGMRASMAALAVCFLFIMTAVMPTLAEGESGRELACHFNSQGALPAKIEVLDERIGSLVFYLDPPLRKGLNTDRLRALTFDEFMHRDAPMAGTTVVLPDKCSRFAAKFLRLESAPYAHVGRHRAYPAEPLWRTSVVQERLAKKDAAK